MHSLLFDASTVILLAKVGLLEQFLDVWKGDAIVTATVAKEAWGQKPSPETAELAHLAEAGRLHVRTVRDQGACQKLQEDFSLGPGEAETIWLASRRSKTIVATDDRLAIRACRALGIPWTSAIAIVVRMVERHGLTAELAEGFLQALSRHGRYHPTLIEDALRRVTRGHKTEEQ